MKKTIHNLATGESETRDMTADEIAEHEVYAAEAEAIKQAQIAKQAARQAVLDKLGLTADEASALLG